MKRTAAVLLMVLSLTIPGAVSAADIRQEAFCL